jgi:VanZ family protein
MISLDGAQGFAVVRQNIDAPEADGLRLVAEQRFVSEEPPGLGFVRVLLLGYSGHARWDLPFGSLVAPENGNWGESSVDIRVDPGVSRFTVFVQNRGIPGQLEVRRVELYPVREAAIFKLLAGFVLFCWVCFGSLCAVALLRASGGWAIKLVVLGVAVAIVSGTVIPKPTLVTSVREMHAMASDSAASARVPPVLWHRLQLTQKTLHVVLFALFVFGLCWWRPRARLGDLVVAVTLFAVSTELLQSFALDREPGLDDVIRDLLGALIGLGCGLIFLAMRGKDSEIGPLIE